METAGDYSGIKDGTSGPNASSSSMPLLQDANSKSLDVGFRGEEADLNTFLRPHSMCSTASVSQATLSRLVSLIQRNPIQIPDMPVVSKSYEDQYLRPPRHNRGERPCVLGNDCICMYLAKVRYGQDTKTGFVGTEFLLPSAREAWLDGKGLPEVHGKCLVCLRYFTTYAYYRARSDPQFGELTRKLETRKHLNEFGPSRPSLKRARIAESEPSVSPIATGDLAWHDANSDAIALPTHANCIDIPDGYRREAALFVDENAMASPAMRTERIGSLIFRSAVRFRSGDYAYRTIAGEQRLVQIGVGIDDTASRRHLNDSPSFGPAGRTTAQANKAVATHDVRFPGPSPPISSKRE